MAVNYWEKFYKEKKAPIKPSNFAKAVEVYFIDELNYGYNKILVDFGAGNGRDTKYLNSVFSCFGLDKNYGIENNKLENKLELGQVYRSDINSIEKLKKVDIVYSRFFLHAISNTEIEHLIEITPKYFVAEFRIKGDKPILYKNHKRNFIDLGWLVNLLIKNNFEILKLQAGKNMAKYKKENPLVARIYAKRNNIYNKNI